MANSIGDTFSNEELDVIARETGFLKRASKLTPQKALDTILFREVHGELISLEDHCVALKHQWDLDIKKQSLGERLSRPETALFIKALLDRVLSAQLSADIDHANIQEELRHFSSVKIKDSIRFQLPRHLKEYYPGSGGAATGAGTHIQYEFDLLGRNPSELLVTDALVQDVTVALRTIQDIKPGDLYLRDLGYFLLAVLKEIQERGAYYISRLGYHADCYNASTGEKIDFKEVHKKLRKKGLTHIEIPILLGKDKHPNRMIVELLPDEQVNRRIAKAEKEAKKKGYTVTDEYRCRARLNIFITNIPGEWISTEKVRTIYRLRWQIELRFKAWKSFFHVHRIRKMHRHRFECYLYATLLLLMINTQIGTSFFAIVLKHARKPLSMLKFLKTVSMPSFKLKLRECILRGGDRLVQHLKELYEISYQRLLLERRNKRTDPLEKILLKEVA